jgi:hypothetical protein
MLSVFAAAVCAFAMTPFASTTNNAKNAVADNAVTNDQSITATTSTTNTTTQPIFGEFMEHRFGGFNGGPRGHGFGDLMRGIEINEAYTAKVNTILGNDTDVANLIAQGYNVTRIMPIIKTVVDGNGTVTTQATNATVLMVGTSGYATVNVDISNSKVTQIITITRTVINK